MTLSDLDSGPESKPLEIDDQAKPLARTTKPPAAAISSMIVVVRVPLSKLIQAQKEKWDLGLGRQTLLSWIMRASPLC
jgi:hypothetical protein